MSPLAVATAGLLIATAAPAQQTDTIRDCIPAETPLQLPAFGEIADSAVLRQSFAGVVVAGPPKGLLLSIGFDLDGRLRQSQVLDRQMGVDSAVIIAKYVMSLVRTQEPARDHWAVRLRIVLADSARFLIERSEYCFAAYDARNSPPAREFITPTLSNAVELRTAGQPRVRVLVSENGTVMRVELAQTSGSIEVDNAILNLYRAARFRPALLDGVPVQGWFDSGRRGFRGPRR